MRYITTAQSLGGCGRRLLVRLLTHHSELNYLPFIRLFFFYNKSFDQVALLKGFYKVQMIFITPKFGGIYFF